MSITTQFQSIISTFTNGSKTIAIKGAHGLSQSHVTASISATHPTIILCNDAETCENTVQNLRFLFAADDKDAILYLPSHENTPFHATSPHPQIVKDRLATLHKIASGQSFKALVLQADSLIAKTVPLSFLSRMTYMIEKGMLINRDELISFLETAGYSRVTTVEDKGCYAVRGSIIDIFWPGFDKPCRIDLFGDEVESIKIFDPSSQRTEKTIDLFIFGPCKEICLYDEAVEHAIEQLQNLADDHNYPTKKLKEKTADLKNGIPFFGIERLLKAFHQELETPFEILLKVCKNPVFVHFGKADLESSFGAILQDYNAHYESSISRGDLTYAPNDYLANKEDVFEKLSAQSQLIFSEFEDPTTELSCPSTAQVRQEILRETVVNVHNQDEVPELLKPLAKALKQHHEKSLITLLPAASFGGTKQYIELLAPLGITIKSLNAVPNLLNKDSLPTFTKGIHAYTYVARPTVPTQGSVLTYLDCVVYAPDEIFGKRSKREGHAGKKGRFGTELSDLEPGNYVVHVDHGLGLFQGLTRLSVRGVEQDYMLLVYAGDDKLYLPVHRISMVQRYKGAEAATVKLDKLGGQVFATKKKKVKEAVMAMAQDLLNLYAKRELAKRPKFSEPDAHYMEFEARFPFETTEDQQKAIDDVLSDMTRERPMDRLICGDVGYGKTEVAMRAAMLAVESGCQVGVLAPTTVLAQQHGITFAERFKESGVSVEVISRFQKPKEVAQTLQKAKDGKVDIVVGTHRLLSQDVAFKNLGLIVVDEEQRFGVKAKEQLKKLRAKADVLTMSATPIPRTLQMGLFGIRDLSIIETPPVDRRAIRTSIIQFDDEVIREAIMRELNRGGQIYFVHNKVSSIQAKADHLRKLVPEAKIEVGHGQMHEDDLEDVMVRFMKHDFNILVCTTIIETGIDVAKANTIFIDDADNFGLAQLYQLRGRVGRSNERAFAYLIIPSAAEHLTPIARKRIEILQKFSELGAGFHIAQHDLELRGAGDLLGKSQHGHVEAVGYDMYAELLKEAVEELRGKAHHEAYDPEVNIPVRAFIPDDYVVDLQERMSFYQRLASADNSKAIWDVVGLMNDQFGETPSEVTNLAEIMLLKQSLRQLRARGLDVAAPKSDSELPKVIFSLGNDAAIDIAKVTAWIAKEPQRVVITPKMKLMYTPTQEEWAASEKNIIALCRASLLEVIEECLG